MRPREGGSLATMRNRPFALLPLGIALAACGGNGGSGGYPPGTKSESYDAGYACGQSEATIVTGITAAEAISACNAQLNIGKSAPSFGVTVQGQLIESIYDKGVAAGVRSGGK